MKQTKNQRQKQEEKQFLKFWDGTKIVLNPKYPGSVFYVKNNEVYFELDVKKNNLWCKTDVFYSISKSREYDYIKPRIQDIIRARLGLIGFDALFSNENMHSDWKEVIKN